MIDTHTHIYKYISLTHIFSELQICKSTHWSMSLEHLKRYLRLSMSKHHSHDFPLLHPRPWQTSSTLLGLFPTFSTRCQKKKKSQNWTLLLTSPTNQSPPTVDSTSSTFLKFIFFPFPCASKSSHCFVHAITISLLKHWLVFLPPSLPLQYNLHCIENTETPNFLIQFR